MKIGILTGGGDCPALNAVIRAAVKTSIGYGWDVLGIEEGFNGLVHCKCRILTTASVSGILHLGGTILGTTNAANPFCYPTVGEGGKTFECDISDTVVSNFRKLGLEALIVIGGDGTLGIAEKFYEKGMPVVGQPVYICGIYICSPPGMTDGTSIQAKMDFRRVTRRLALCRRSSGSCCG